MTTADNRVQKVAIQIDAFLRGCDEHRVDPNTELRSAYAIWVSQQRG
jgi:hypothetical protein